MARAHERMTQADLAEAHAAAQQPREAERHGRDTRRSGAGAPAAGSHAAGRAQAEQLQALSRAELVHAQPFHHHAPLCRPGIWRTTKHTLCRRLRSCWRLITVSSMCLAGPVSPGRLPAHKPATQCLWLLTSVRCGALQDEDSPYGFLSTSDSEAEEHHRQPQRMSMRQQERALRSRAR